MNKKKNPIKLLIIVSVVFFALVAIVGISTNGDTQKKKEEMQATVDDINKWMDEEYIPRRQAEEGEASDSLVKIALIEKFRLVDDKLEISMPSSIKLTEANKNELANLGNMLLLEYAKDRGITLDFGNFNNETYPEKKIGPLYVVSF